MKTFNLNPSNADLWVDIRWKDGREWHYFVGGEAYEDLRGPKLAEIIGDEVRQIIADQEGRAPKPPFQLGPLIPGAQEIIEKGFGLPSLRPPTEPKQS